MNQFNFPNIPQMIDLNEFIQRSPDLVKKLIRDKVNLYKKWSPVISRGFDDIRLTEENLTNICVYCELCNMYYENMRNAGFKIVGDELSGVLTEIRTKISESETKRVPVLRKVYNYKNGFMEYELEDGTFVKIVNESVVGPKIDVSKDIFCEQFVKLLDPTAYRDMKIDKLL